MVGGGVCVGTDLHCNKHRRRSIPCKPKQFEQRSVVQGLVQDCELQQLPSVEKRDCMLIVNGRACESFCGCDGMNPGIPFMVFGFPLAGMKTGMIWLCVGTFTGIRLVCAAQLQTSLHSSTQFPLQKQSQHADIVCDSCGNIRQRDMMSVLNFYELKM